MWLSLWCIISILIVHPSVVNGNTKRHRCGTSLLRYEKQSDLPDFEPSKYIADDPKDFKPFNIHFVIPRNMSENGSIQEWLDEAATYINGRLSIVIKAPPIEDIRIERKWNESTGQCGSPMCGDVVIPGEYAHPCRHPGTGKIVKEKGVREKPNYKVAQMNLRKNITLVVFVEMGKCYDGPKRCHYPDWDNVFWYGRSCQRDKNSNRPTHGFVAICDPDLTVGGARKPDEIAAFFHQILHIILSDSIVGFGSPHLNCAPEKDGELIPFPCEGVTYKAIQRKWLEANGTLTRTKAYVVTTENVKRAVQEYFHCPVLEGAETEPPDVRRSDDACDSVVPNGSWYPLVHWSGRLFSDEIMNPFTIQYGRLSFLTLGLLKDLGWYEVDMDAGDPMEISRPQRYGCDVAQKSCHENIQSARKHNRSDIVTLPKTGPYCDNDYSSKDEVVTLRCIDDREPLMCLPLDPDCGVIIRSWQYDEPACDLYHSDKGGMLGDGPGVAVGPGTICVSTGPIYKQGRVHETTSFGRCVKHTCDLVERKLRLILKVSGGSCEIDCPADMSNKQKMVSFNDSEHCMEPLGEFRIICPNYTNVCVHLPRRSTPTTRPPGLQELTTRSQGLPLKCQASTIVLITVITALTMI